MTDASTPRPLRSGAPKIQGIDDFPDEAPSTNQLAVYVYETPVRVWHWINFACIVVLIGTGLFIHKPPISLMGEASEHYLLGTVRGAHFIAGYIAGIGFAARAAYALFSKNHHAKQLFAPPLFSRRFWNGVLHELRWYFFLEREPRKYVGHNPMAQLAMFFLFTTMMTLMVCTGFALYGEGTGAGSWAHVVFTSWVLPLAGHNSLHLHTIHHLGMWMIVIFSIVHIYAAIREDVMSRQSLVSTMISGWRMFKDNRP
jgi:Ni/Fe-hydrogenase 1 B-type cytochrome subunit